MDPLSVRWEQANGAKSLQEQQRLMRQESSYEVYGKHDRIPANFPSTTACSVAFASALVVATPTLTLAQQPSVSTTEVSVGSLKSLVSHQRMYLEPKTNLPPLSQVTTSFAVSEVAVLILESTNLKSDKLEQLELLTAGKLTFSHMFSGRQGFPEAIRVFVTLVDRSAYLYAIKSITRDKYRTQRR